MCRMCRAWGEENPDDQIGCAVAVMLSFNDLSEFSMFTESIVAPLKDLANSGLPIVKEFYRKHMLALSEIDTREKMLDAENKILDDLMEAIKGERFPSNEFREYGIIVALCEWFEYQWGYNPQMVFMPEPLATHLTLRSVGESLDKAYKAIDHLKGSETDE